MTKHCIACGGEWWTQFHSPLCPSCDAVTGGQVLETPGQIRRIVQALRQNGYEVSAHLESIAFPAPRQAASVRDPNRIDQMLGVLRELWVKNPDCRLGQIVVNATGAADPFYVEDDVTLRGLERLVQNSAEHRATSREENDGSLPTE